MPYYVFLDPQTGSLALEKAAQEEKGKPNVLVGLKEDKIHKSLLPDLLTTVSKTENELSPGETLEINDLNIKTFQVVTYEEEMGWRNLLTQEKEELIGYRTENGVKVLNDSEQTKAVKLIAWLPTDSYDQQTPPVPPSPTVATRTHESITLAEVD